MTDHSQTHPHHAAHVSLVVALTALALTAGFHFFVAERPYGFAMALFVALVIVGIHVMAVASSRQVNMWSYLFLVPVLSATLAEVLYASPVVRGVGFIVILVSLALFAYWMFVPRQSVHEATTFVPGRLIAETLWPFGGVAPVFHRMLFKHRLSSVFVGALIAVPFLIVISLLFASADPLFGKAVRTIFDFTDLRLTIFKIFRDAFIFLYFTGAGWLMLERVTRHVHALPNEEPRVWDQSVITTFLALLNVLFVSFLAFQGAYFFGGENFIASKGIVYSEYARSGFYELMTVSLLVFAIAGVVYKLTAMRWRAGRILLLALVAQTMAILVSAVIRLSLYIQAYGLTVERWWAGAVIALAAIALVFLFAASLARWTYRRLAKGMLMAGLWTVSLLLLINVEDQVVRVNTERFLKGETRNLDTVYLQALIRQSSDGLPRFILFLNADWPSEQLNNSANIPLDENHRTGMRSYVESILDGLRKGSSDDWRNLVVSDYRALAAPILWDSSRLTRPQ